MPLPRLAYSPGLQIHSFVALWSLYSSFQAGSLLMPCLLTVMVKVMGRILKKSSLRPMAS
jgi:hypothetical protein